jgi:hypothetical protein
MDLAVLAKQKNRELTVHAVALQQQLNARLTAPKFHSFLMTFVVAPFALGVITRLVPVRVRVNARQVAHAFFRGFHVWPRL